MLSSAIFNAATMPKPDDWHYVVVNHTIAIGHCADDKCSFAAYAADGKPLATIKIPFQELADRRRHRLDVGVDEVQGHGVLSRPRYSREHR